MEHYTGDFSVKLDPLVEATRYEVIWSCNINFKIIKNVFPFKENMF
jgi:hypothetical protein